MTFGCVLTDPLFTDVAIASGVVGFFVGIVLMAIADDERQEKPPVIIFCTKEDLDDPDFVERMYRAQGGSDGA